MYMIQVLVLALLSLIKHTSIQSCFTTTIILLIFPARGTKCICELSAYKFTHFKAGYFCVCMYCMCLNYGCTGDAFPWLLTAEAQPDVTDTLPVWHQPH